MLKREVKEKGASSAGGVEDQLPLSVKPYYLLNGPPLIHVGMHLPNAFQSK